MGIFPLYVCWRYVHLYMNRHACGHTYMWGWRLVWEILIHLIHGGKVSHSKSELTHMAHYAGQPALEIVPFWDWNYSRTPTPNSVCMGSGDLSSDPHALPQMCDINHLPSWKSKRSGLIEVLQIPAINSGFIFLCSGIRKKKKEVHIVLCDKQEQLPYKCHLECFLLNCIFLENISLKIIRYLFVCVCVCHSKCVEFGQLERVGSFIPPVGPRDQIWWPGTFTYWAILSAPWGSS